MPEMCWKIPIARWSIWPGGHESAVADGLDVQFIPPMLRRRLGRLAKMSLHVAHTCAEGLDRVRLVYCSQHGDLHRTMTLLNDLATDEPLSPTAFSLSVHNSAAGIFSIVRGDTSPTTAIAAGNETFGFGLMEAAGQYWADPTTPVLLVYVDEPIPDEYRNFAEPCESAHAVALLLASEVAHMISCEVGTVDNNAPPSSHGQQSAAFLQCLTEITPTSWAGKEREWTWRNDS